MTRKAYSRASYLLRAFLMPAAVVSVCLVIAGSGRRSQALDASPVCVGSSTFVLKDAEGNPLTPVNPYWTDDPVTLGMKFRSDVDGFVTGVRFYKDARNSMPHVGMLWSSAGDLLASATFEETESGWQEVSFSNPIAIMAGTTYVAAYHTESGYAQDTGFFTAGWDTPPLHALADSEGGNGVYRYDPSPGQIVFPSLSAAASNYYVDAVFRPAGTCDDGNPCTDDTCDPITGCTNIAKPDNTLCDDADACTLGDTCQSGQCIPDVFLAASIFDPSTTPTNPHYPDRPVTLGVKFRSDVDGFVTGVRFYKDAQNNGTHIGMLWAGTGGPFPLASATFTETESGWQEVSFSSPVAITAGTTYVASYHTETGYPQDSGSDVGSFTLAGVDSPPLHALQDGVDGGNGVYGYDDQLSGQIVFPDQTFGGSNYYVDVVFATALLCDDGNFCTLDSCDPAAGCVNTPRAECECTPSETRACGTDEGECVSGTQTCQGDGTFGTCEGAVDPQAEECDGLDNDCDGATDEDDLGQPLNQACYSGPEGTAGVGVCQAGRQSCTGGGYGTCVGEVMPSAELCDGLDNDCDGATDEDDLGQPLSQSCYSGAEGTAGVGVCQAGTQTCTGGGYGTCVGEMTPTAEACDGLDNDCDGTPDNFVVASIFDPSTTPTHPHFDDPRDVTLGVKFRSDVDGFVAGVRFYKDSRNGGTHVGMLWSIGGELLASATFVENESGWQQVSFSSPVAITAGTTYVASYHTEVGYPQDSGSDVGSFTLAGVDSPPLHALKDGVDGGNGVYGYDPSPGEIVFPDQTFGGSNYYVDVVFETARLCDDGNFCTLDSCDPAAGCVNTPQAECVCTPSETRACGTDEGECVSGTQTCQGDGTFGTCVGAVGPQAEACDSLDNDCDGATDEDAAEQPLSQSCYSGAEGTAGVGVCQAGTQTCTGGSYGTCVGEVTPSAEVCDGVDNDCDGAADNFVAASIFDPSTTPTNPHFPDRPVTLGVKFRSDVNGFVTGVRFYKDARNNGPHIGMLWAGTGGPLPLASATFTETESGWQEVSFSSPVPIAANTTYIASYHTSTGYPQDSGSDVGSFTLAGVDSPPLHALQDGVDGGNGVYGYDPSPEQILFPDQTFGGSNYYVDVVFATALLCDDGIFCTLDSCDPAAGCVNTPRAECECTPSETRACGTDEGECVSGTQTCQGDGTFGTCVGALDPQAEACDGLDNDCDGAVDNGFTLGVTCSVGTGACEASGVTVCTADGSGTMCNAQAGEPVPETCNSVDDDCDGAADEDAGGQPLSQSCYSGPEGTAGVGVCQGGTQTCSGGTYGICVGEVTPSAEVCDGLDNDCDNFTDEDQPILQCGVGACQRQTPSCVGGEPQVCMPGEPSPEVCDGIDNDCDGIVDQGVPAVQATTSIDPNALNLNARGNAFSVTVTLTNLCDPDNPQPIEGSRLGQMFVSRAGETTLDPSLFSCPDPIRGFAFETGIFENLAAREVSGNTVTLKFNTPIDRDCRTLDGDRQELHAVLRGTPDGTEAPICVKGVLDGLPGEPGTGARVEACTSVMVLNKRTR